MTTDVQDKAIVSSVVPKSLYDELVRRATESDRSLSAEVRRILVRHFDGETQEQT